MRLASRGLILAALGATMAIAVAGDNGKKDDRSARLLEQKLAALGHRNWVAIVDSAYPLQVSPGVEMLVVGGDHLTTVRTVLDLIDKSKHVRPKVYLDAELPYVTERDARGVGRLRAELKTMFGRRPVQSLPHGKILGMMETTARSYSVLVLKTNCAVPYTSVFLELDCGYWSDDAENRLREAMKKPGEDK